jgi:class 3 adenylate cyclase
MVSSRTAEDSVSAGREALARHAWGEAFELLSEADRSRPLSPQDLEVLGEAAWWAGQADAMIQTRERAFSAYMEEGNQTRAAAVALKLASDYSHRLERAVAQGWLSRARRLLEKLPESAEHGYLERVEGVHIHEAGGDREEALRRARAALDIASRHGDRDLQAMALMDQGRILASMGRKHEGQPLMDEAMVAAVSGEVGPFATGIVYCNMIGSCEQLADYRRAGEWTDAARRWCERQSINGFPGVCRVHRAEVMRLRGAWVEAEEEARQACQELGSFNLLDFAGEGFYEVGEIRLRMGDLDAAEEAFRQAHELGKEPHPGRDLLRLARGKVDAAASGIEDALAEVPDPLARVRLLPARVDVALAGGDLDRARASAEELRRIADEFETPFLQACAGAAAGSVRLAEGDHDGARSELRRALRQWQGADAPYEAARTRVLLAESARMAGDAEAALLELGAARSTFERLGAALDLQRVDGLLRETEKAAPAARVVRTFMFTDIVGSTNLVEAVGDEAWEDLVGWHDRTLRGLFAEHRGEEVDHAGDGFFVAFEDASSAVACASAIQRSLGEHRRQHGFAPQVRIGLHAAEATERSGDYGGKGVHQAARVGALAGGGEILATEETAQSADVQRSEAREVSLKGISEPVRVVSLDWRTQERT